MALDTTSPTDIDASTLPKETIVELTSSSDASKSSLVIVNVDGSKSDGGKDIEEIKPKSAIASEVSSESSLNSDIAVVDEKKDSEVVNDGSSDSSTTTTESAAAAVAEVSAEKESSSSTSANKKDEKSVAQPAVVSEEYKTMKSIIDNYKSSKKSSSSSTTTSSSSSSKNEVVTSVVSSDLTAIAVPGLLISSIVGVASSFLNNGDDELEGGEGGAGGGVAAMDDKKKASSSSTEWKMEQPTPYGLQDTTPKYYPPGQQVQVVEEKKPIEPTTSTAVKGQNKSKYFGTTSPSSPTLPKPTNKIKASKSISMANIVKEAKNVCNIHLHLTNMVTVSITFVRVCHWSMVDIVRF